MGILNKLRRSKSPPPGPQTGAQDLSRVGATISGLPGFGPGPAGSYATYRAMSAHPTIALARSIVTAPILAGSWSFAVEDGAPAESEALIASQLNRLRQPLVRDALRALEFGWYGFEKIYDTSGGRVILRGLKPLLPELTEILVDTGGNFAGLRQDHVTLAPEKCFVYAYDGEAGNLYGRSRHENCRRRWGEWEQVAEKAAQYQKKVANIVTQVHYPEGTSRDAAGAEVSNYLSALRIAEAVAAGKSVVIPNLFAGADDVTRASQLAGKSQYVLSFLDPGGTDFAPGFIAQLRYLDALLFRGWLRPERTGLEGITGSRAEAQVHTDTGEIDSELIHADVVAAVNASLVDELLALNFGEQARGAVRIVPAPIVDRKTDILKQVLSGLLASSTAQPELLRRMNLDALLDQLDVPRFASQQ